MIVYALIVAAALAIVYRLMFGGAWWHAAVIGVVGGIGTYFVGGEYG